jgi:hypothetical protein
MQETTMQIPLTSVQTAGVAIRTLRKRAGIRIDDFALTAIRQGDAQGFAEKVNPISCR